MEAEKKLGPKAVSHVLYKLFAYFLIQKIRFMKHHIYDSLEERGLEKCPPGWMSDKESILGLLIGLETTSFIFPILEEPKDSL